MKKWMYNTFIIIFGVVFVVSAGYLVWYLIDAKQQDNRYDQISQLHVQQTPRPTVDPNTGETINPTYPSSTLTEVTDPETGEIISVLPEFSQLYVLNNDIVGWISIPGTSIDYPVMQTPKNPDYYLDHNFDKKYNKHGCIYAQGNCDVFTPSDNITLYGHHMKDGSMFAKLDNYTDEEFYKENPYIYFDTLTELHTYQIIAVFKTTATVGKGFAYHNFVQATSEEDYNKFVANCKKLAFYDTGVDAQYGDKLITLSTCEYTQTNGRLVVVAKRIA